MDKQKEYSSDQVREHSPIEVIDASFRQSYQFPVYFSQGVFENQNTLLLDTLRQQISSYVKVLVYVDAGITSCNHNLIPQIKQYFTEHQSHIKLLAEPLETPGGEAAKKQSEIESLYAHMLKHEIDRHCCVLAIGGGAMLDAVGFASATFHRGIPLIRMPSTVLAQNDAGIGVKNGYNAYSYKNLIGSFSPPRAVINDFDLLKTLQKRDMLSGLAEAIKVAAIRDENFFSWLEQNTESLKNFEPEATQYAIARCAQLHLHQITNGGDPFETGNARPLDYGHWSAHKLESLLNYEIRHGEAVAIGMALDAHYAAMSGYLDTDQMMRMITLLESLDFKLWHDTLDKKNSQNQHALLQGLEDFRQHLGGALCITMLTKIGEAKDVNEIDNDRMLSSINWLQSRALSQ